MKIIEALKKTKDLAQKADDLRGKIAGHSAISSLQTPEYDDQCAQVREWLQAHSDVLKEVVRLQIAIQRTNLETVVDVELGGKVVKKTIAEWIHRRRNMAAWELQAWKGLTDRNIQEGRSQMPGGDVAEIKIVRYYDPKERDAAMDVFISEPSAIDGRLEIANAVTDLIE